MHYKEKNPLLNFRSINSVNFNLLHDGNDKNKSHWYTIQPTKTTIEYGQLHAQILHGILVDISVTIKDLNDKFFVFDETLRGFHEPGYEGDVELDDAPLLPIDLLKNACQFIEDSLRNKGGE